MNIVYSTKFTHDGIIATINNLIHEGLNGSPEIVSPFRNCACYILANDGRTFNEIFDNIADDVEIRALRGNINPQDSNAMYTLIDGHFNNAIPYLVMRDINRMNLNYNDRATIENDASNYVNMMSNIRRDLISLNQNGNPSSYGGYNQGFNGGSQGFNGGSQGFNGGSQGYNGNQGYNNGNRTSIFSQSGGQSRSNFQGNGGFGPRSTNYYENIQTGTITSGMMTSGQVSQKRGSHLDSVFSSVLGRVDTPNTSNNQQNQVNNQPQETNQEYYSQLAQFNKAKESAYEDVVEEAPVVSDVVLGTGTDIDFESFSKPKSVTAMVNTDNGQDVVSTTVVRNPGTSWLPSTTDPFNGSTSMDYAVDKKLLEIRKINHPRIFPLRVNACDVKFTKGIGKININGVQEEVFNNNYGPTWKIWDVTTARCEIHLNEMCWPVQQIIPLTKGERMEMLDHLIPGHDPLPGTIGTVVGYSGNVLNDWNADVASLSLSSEELEEQNRKIMSSVELDDIHFVEEIEKGIFIENLTELPYTTLMAIEVSKYRLAKKRRRETLERHYIEKLEDATRDELTALEVEDEFEDITVPKTTITVDGEKISLVRCNVIISNDTFSKEQQRDLVNTIKSCKTLDEYKRLVHDKLIEREEYVLARKLSAEIDNQYRKILLRCSVNSISVSDVINCHQKVESDYVHDSRLERYKNMVAKMLETFVDEESMELAEKDLDPEDKSPTPFAVRGAMVYVDKVLSDFTLSAPEGLDRWTEIDVDNTGIIYSIAKYLIVNKLKYESGAGRDTYILTADGCLLEVISFGEYDISKIYIRRVL